MEESWSAYQHGHEHGHEHGRCVCTYILQSSAAQRSALPVVTVVQQPSSPSIAGAWRENGSTCTMTGS
jgi:hypothetical protein